MNSDYRIVYPLDPWHSEGYYVSLKNYESTTRCESPELAQAISRHYRAEAAKLGAYVLLSTDYDSGYVSRYDMVMHVPDLEAAFKLAEDEGQSSVWDIAAGELVYLPVGES